MTKPVKQPIVTQKERNRITEYLKAVKRQGYRPWVTVRQSHTIGQGQVINSWKTERNHHFLGRGELQPFFHFEHDPNVVDIFEQYPLPIAETMQIAKELNIVHPRSYIEAEDFDGSAPAKTMTTDYVVLYRDNKLHAYNFKYSESLDSTITSPQSVARTLAKNSIERAFHSKHDIGWTQITEKSFDPNITANLMYLRECFSDEDALTVDDHFKAIVLSRLCAGFEQNPDATVREVLETVAIECGISLFQCQCLFQWFAYHHLFTFNWLVPIDLNRPLSVNVTRGNHAR